MVYSVYEWNDSDEDLRSFGNEASKVMVSFDNNDHSLGKWSDTIQNLSREYRSKGDGYSIFALMSMHIQSGRGCPPPTPMASSFAT